MDATYTMNTKCFGVEMSKVRLPSDNQPHRTLLYKNVCSQFATVFWEDDGKRWHLVDVLLLNNPSWHIIRFFTCSLHDGTCT